MNWLSSTLSLSNQAWWVPQHRHRHQHQQHHHHHIGRAEFRLILARALAQVTLVKFSSGNKPPVKGIVDNPMKLKDLIKEMRQQVTSTPDNWILTKSIRILLLGRGHFFLIFKEGVGHFLIFVTRAWTFSLIATATVTSRGFHLR